MLPYKVQNLDGVFSLEIDKVVKLKYFCKIPAFFFKARIWNLLPGGEYSPNLPVVGCSTACRFWRVTANTALNYSSLSELRSFDWQALDKVGESPEPWQLTVCVYPDMARELQGKAFDSHWGWYIQSWFVHRFPSPLHVPFLYCLLSFVHPDSNIYLYSIFWIQDKFYFKTLQ